MRRSQSQQRKSTLRARIPDLPGRPVISPPKSVTVLVDSREKKPLLFPRMIVLHSELPDQKPEPSVIKVQVNRVTMSEGDYALKGQQSIALVERKGGIDELCQNVTKPDSTRFMAAINRLVQATKYPYLFLDMTPLSLWSSQRPTPTTHGNGQSMDPMWVFDRLLRVATTKNLRIIWGTQRSPGPSSRKRLGEIILRLLIHHQLEEESQ